MMKHLIKHLYPLDSLCNSSNTHLLISGLLFKYEYKSYKLLNLEGKIDVEEVSEEFKKEVAILKRTIK